MKYNELSLKRHQNAGRKVAFSKSSTTADFAPLWQAGALAGAGLGAIKGGLDQNEDGTQIDPASRLMNVGINAGAGATLLGAAGAGLPQLMQENPAARMAGQGLYNATGITPDMRQVPMNYADRVRYQREVARRQGNTLLQRAQRTIDPVTGRLEILAQDVGNITRPVTDVVGKGVQAVAQQFQPDPSVQMQQQAIKQAVNASVADESARLAQQAVRQHLQSPEVAAQINRQATQNANKFVQQVVDTRNPLQRGVDTAVDVAKATPQVAQQVGQAAQKTGEALKVGGTKAVELGRDALAVPYQVAQSPTGQAVGNAVRQGWQAAGNKAKQDIQTVRRLFRFSYMGETAEFYAPYTVGAAGGAVLGTGIGAGLGIANSINRANDMEQSQLDNIQAIPDPYARKKEWDTYDADLSRAGRNLGYTVGGAGNTLLNAGLGAAGGALLGGAALTGYENLRNKRFNVFGQRTPSRLDALKTVITGT